MRRSFTLITLIGALVTGVVAYFSMSPARWKQVRRNLFAGRAFSRLLLGQYLRKLRFVK